MRRSIVIIAIIGILFIIFARVFVMSKGGGNMTEITVPNYNGQSDVYYTDKYIEKDGCIQFKDGLGIDHKVCGNYSIHKW